MSFHWRFYSFDCVFSGRSCDSATLFPSRCSVHLCFSNKRITNSKQLELWIGERPGDFIRGMMERCLAHRHWYANAGMLLCVRLCVCVCAGSQLEKENQWHWLQVELILNISVFWRWRAGFPGESRWCALIQNGRTCTFNIKERVRGIEPRRINPTYEVC